MARLEAEADYYRDMIREQGYVDLDFPISGADIDPLFEQFRELSELAWARDGSGERLVEAMHYVIPERPEDADYYLTHRREGEINLFSRDTTPGKENKDLAHFGPLSYALARAKLGNHMPEVMRQFLDSCVELHEATKTSVRPVLEALGIDKIMLAENPHHDIHMVRVLRYLGTSATHKADLHFDRSAATFAAWESSPGLVGAPGNNAYGQASLNPEELEHLIAQADASPIEHVSGKGKFFLSAGYNRLPQAVHEQNGALPLLAHGVINEAPEEPRDAVVVFLNPHRYYKEYTIPPLHETGLSTIQQHLLSSQTPEAQVA